MTTAELQKHLGKNCQVTYGKKGLVQGTLNSVSANRVYVQSTIGEYGIPTEQVTSITPL